MEEFGSADQVGGDAGSPARLELAALTMRETVGCANPEAASSPKVRTIAKKVFIGFKSITSKPRLAVGAGAWRAGNHARSRLFSQLPEPAKAMTRLAASPERLKTNAQSTLPTSPGRDSSRPLPPATYPYERISHIRLLPWMNGVKANTRIRMHDADAGNTPAHRTLHALLVDTATLAPTAQRLPPVPANRITER